MERQRVPDIRSAYSNALLLLPKVPVLALGISSRESSVDVLLCSRSFLLINKSFKYAGPILFVHIDVTAPCGFYFPFYLELQRGGKYFPFTFVSRSGLWLEPTTLRSSIEQPTLPSLLLSALAKFYIRI